MKYIILIGLLLTINYGFGQTAKYGELTKKGNYKTYISKESKIFNVGDTLTIGKPSLGDRFAFITQGEVGTARWLTDNKIIINKIKCHGRGPLNYKVYFSVKGYGWVEVLIDYEAAYEAYEIIE